MTNDPKWLEWAKRLAAAAQSGLEYSTNPFDLDRYESIRQIAVEIMAEFSQTEHARLAALFADETGHATPKVDVRGVVFRDDNVLLVRESADGRWSLPGGWADVYDTPSQATVREIREESGYETRAVKLLAAYDRDRQGHPPMPFHAYKLFFLCELVGGTPSGSIETTDVDFFPEDRLPELSVGRVTDAQIHRFFVHHYHPDLPTDFD